MDLDQERWNASVFAHHVSDACDESMILISIDSLRKQRRASHFLRLSQRAPSPTKLLRKLFIIISRFCFRFTVLERGVKFVNIAHISRRNDQMTERMELLSRAREQQKSKRFPISKRWEGAAKKLLWLSKPRSARHAVSQCSTRERSKKQTPNNMPNKERSLKWRRKGATYDGRRLPKELSQPLNYSGSTCQTARH